MKTLHIIVSGRVQGVFYRINTQRVAKSLGLNGTVRNLDTGEVEIFAQGKTKSLKELLKWARRGSKMAKVLEIESKWMESNKVYRDFLVLR